MSDNEMLHASTPSGDREYFWFALLLIVVLTTSVNHSSALRSSASTLETHTSAH